MNKHVIVVIGLVALAGGSFYLFGGDDRIAFVPDDADMVGGGARIYADACASCHGENLEGEANWQVRKADGKLPAPPHDATGHTWHHPDQHLFEITKLGVRHFAGADYATDMPAFGDVYSDHDIIAVLSYIKSTWPLEIRQRHDELNANSPN
jgi:S-disulfanyl-L-cysteine oxidoreductase SoxD